MIPYWRSVMDLTYREWIQFAVKAANDAILLFSERNASTIDYNNDYDYVMVNIGSFSNQLSFIRVGKMDSNTACISTPDMLDNSQFKYFWASWFAGVMEVGYGFEIGRNIFMNKTYPAATTDIKFLALFNGWGSTGRWKLYPGTIMGGCQGDGNYIQVP